MSGVEDDWAGLGTRPGIPEDSEDPEKDVSGEDVIWVPNDPGMMDDLIHDGTIPEGQNLQPGSNTSPAPIRLSNGFSLVLETLNNGNVFIRCADEPSRIDSDRKNDVSAQELAHDIVGQVLDGMGIEQKGQRPLGKNDVEIIYEAAGPDEVQTEEFTVEEEESEEEGEIKSRQDDSDTARVGINNSPDSFISKPFRVPKSVGEDRNADLSFRLGFENVRPVGPRPERQFKEFQADDDMERADILDEGWEVQKSLRTDVERLFYAQRAFGNCIKTDPTRCLTFHGFSNLSERQKGAVKFLDEGKGEVLVNMWMHTKIENGMIFNEHAPGHSKVRPRKRRASGDHEDAPDSKRLRMEFERLRMEFGLVERSMWTMLDRLKRPIFENTGGYSNNKMNFRRYVGHYKSGLNETREFLNFYDDKNNNTLVEEEVTHMGNWELLFKQSVNIYGHNTTELCKDCSYQEQMDVRHPY